MTEPTPPIAESPPSHHQQSATSISSSPALPRVTIKYCTQCKWLLRAAYFAQELLSTFSTSLGEVSLLPSSGGVFIVSIYYSRQPQPESESESESGSGSVEERVIWDRKRDGGFPETKALKAAVRNIIDPSRDLGHTDRALKAQSGTEEKECKDCQ